MHLLLASCVHNLGSSLSRRWLGPSSALVDPLSALADPPPPLADAPLTLADPPPALTAGLPWRPEAALVVRRQHERLGPAAVPLQRQRSRSVSDLTADDPVVPVPAAARRAATNGSNPFFQPVRKPCMRANVHVCMCACEAAWVAG